MRHDNAGYKPNMSEGNKCISVTNTCDTCYKPPYHKVYAAHLPYQKVYAEGYKRIYATQCDTCDSI